MKLKPEQNSDLNGIRTHDLYDTDTVFYQLSYQVIWELVKEQWRTKGGAQGGCLPYFG